jgi:hypothetical protein
LNGPAKKGPCAAPPKADIGKPELGVVVSGVLMNQKTKAAGKIGDRLHLVVFTPFRGRLFLRQRFVFDRPGRPG